MTVSYQYEVASSTSGGFTRLLFMWRGSLYKLIYRELLMFLGLFGVISAIYRHLLSQEHKRSFEQVVVYCDTFINLIPLSFVLGFYVAYVASRWWQQYTAIPWPDKVMHSVALYVTGNDEYGRMLRRALMRYLNLSLILVLRSISSAVKRRFPTLDHVVDSGFMTSLELDLFISVPSIEFNTYWIPCTWFINLLKEARTNHRLTDPQGLKIIMEEFNDFRSKCGMLWSYDWVSIPLVYTQVVTLATYSFFAVALVGRQYIEGVIKPFQMKIDIYFPVFTVLQFFFFMGLLKVAEQLINPFGDDDEDFELNWLIDRHTKVSYLGVDTLMNRCPPLVKDIYYDSENLILPYTEAAAAYKRKTYRGSVANMTVPEEKQTMFLPNITEEDENRTGNMTPRASSASLAVHNDSPLASNRRQGGSTPLAARRLAGAAGETVVAVDMREDPDQSAEQVSLGKQGSSNGRPASAFAEAVKMFRRPELTGRRPFFALAKTARVSIQPWPSATNLKSDRSAAEQPQPVIRHASSFNIPSIDVRQASVDQVAFDDTTDIDDDDDDDDDDDEDDDLDFVDDAPVPKPVPPARRSAQQMFEARDRQSPGRRGFLGREASIEETQEPQQRPPRQRTGRTKKRSRAGRFNSFPKFLARRQRPSPRRIASPTSPGRRGRAAQLQLAESKSSPELRLDVVAVASTSAASAATCERVTFFAGNDPSADEDEQPGGKS